MKAAMAGKTNKSIMDSNPWANQMRKSPAGGTHGKGRSQNTSGQHGQEELKLLFLKRQNNTTSDNQSQDRLGKSGESEQGALSRNPFLAGNGALKPLATNVSQLNSGISKSKSASCLSVQNNNNESTFLGVNNMKNKFEVSPGASPSGLRKQPNKTRSQTSSPVSHAWGSRTNTKNQSDNLKSVLQRDTNTNSDKGLNKILSVGKSGPWQKDSSPENSTDGSSSGKSVSAMKARFDSQTPPPRGNTGSPNQRSEVLLPSRSGLAQLSSSESSSDEASVGNDKPAVSRTSPPSLLPWKQTTGPVSPTPVPNIPVPPPPTQMNSQQDDHQVLMQKVPAPIPRPRKTKSKGGPMSGVPMATNHGNQTNLTSTNRQDRNNNKQNNSDLLSEADSKAPSGGNFSGLDDGYFELSNSTTISNQAEISKSVSTSASRSQVGSTPQASLRRQLHIFSDDLESAVTEGNLDTSDVSSPLRHDKKHGERDRLALPSEEDTTVDQRSKPTKQRPVCPLPSGVSNSQAPKSFLFAKVQTEVPPPDASDGFISPHEYDIPVEYNPPPLPEKTRTATYNAKNRPTEGMLPVKMKQNIPTKPEELTQAVPPPNLPPRNKTPSAKGSNFAENRETSTTPRQKFQRPRLETIDTGSLKITHSGKGKLQKDDSIDELGAPPPPPRLPPPPPPPPATCSPRNKVVNPNTVVPAPVSPSSPPHSIESQEGQGRSTRRLMVEVPAPSQQRNHDTGPTEDDFPTSPPPLPPGCVKRQNHLSPGRNDKDLASYIDPNSVASRPNNHLNVAAPGGLRLEVPVAKSPFPELSPDSNKKKSGKHRSYLDLFSYDEEEPAQQDSDYYSFLEEEPLYQVYHRDAVAREIVHQTDAPMSPKETEDDDYLYMDAASVQLYVSNMLLRGSQDYGSPQDVRQSSLQDVVKLGAGTRKLWCEMPEVKDSGCINEMSAEDKKLQESLFEVITSEASYVKSLNLLKKHFYDSAVFDADSVHFSVISKQDHHVLFSNLKKVREVGQKFLQRLEAMWHQSCILNPVQLTDFISKFAQRFFDVYVMYVKNQMYQERTLKKLRDNNSEFQQALYQLEIDPGSQGLTLQSFLVLPMQRVTRYPLLIDSICHRMKQNQPGYDQVSGCLSILQKIVRQCNEGARQMENIEQVANISQMLQFKNVRTIPIVSQHRSLVKQGQLTRILPQSTGLLARKKENVHLFLFNDLLLITKKKGHDQYQVIEHTSRIHIHADILNQMDVAKWLPQGAPKDCRHLIIMVLLESDVRFIFSAESMSERMRWVEAVTPPQHVSEDERIYEEWDCPQVQVIQRYIAQQPDEISLEESDVINVTRKMADGWYEGERIRDGEKGWFPSSVTVEIQSAHLRAKNLRQHYRMLLGMSKDVAE